MSDKIEKVISYAKMVYEMLPPGTSREIMIEASKLWCVSEGLHYSMIADHFDSPPGVPFVVESKETEPNNEQNGTETGNDGEAEVPVQRGGEPAEAVRSGGAGDSPTDGGERGGVREDQGTE